jgi:hypothetical protein
MTDAPHVHAPDRAHALLRVEWCACGHERRTDRRNAGWTTPRLFEGMLRAAQRGE